MMNDLAENWKDHPAFVEGVLEPAYHESLVRDIDRCAEEAGLGKNNAEYIYQKMPDDMPFEKEWLEGFASLENGTKSSGLRYMGSVEDPDVLSRMMAMTGCFVRNYINAKMLTLQEILKILKEDDTPDARVLFIPNFYLPANDEGKIANWLVSGLHGLLLERHKAGLQTVLYIQSLKGMEKEYGSQISDLVNNYYIKARS